jgi:hypothetical protein
MPIGEDQEGTKCRFSSVDSVLSRFVASFDARRIKVRKLDRSLENDGRRAMEPSELTDPMFDTVWMGELIVLT